QGSQIISTFFQTAATAAHALEPILRTLGTAFGELVINLMQMGTQMAPGINSFFQSLGQALNVLGQSLTQSGPAIGEILVVLGTTLLQMVQQLGPQLPPLFEVLAQTFVELAPAAVEVAKALADIMSHLTPTEVEAILGIVAAFQALSVVVPIITG